MANIKIPGGIPELPESVIDRLELVPPQHFFLRILRDAFPDVYVTPRLPYNSLNRQLQLPHDPMILVRKGFSAGGNDSDPRFTGEAMMEVHVFTTDPDGERKAALISEACRVALRDAWINGHTHYEGLGTVLRITMTNEPTRKTDWATATGPVQYADLPSGAWRYETRYRIKYRKDI